MQPPFGPNLPALNSDSRSTDAGSANEDETGVTPCPSTVSVQSHIRFVLDNFFIAMSLISFVILIIFTVIWLAVLRDATAQPIRELSNSTGVRLRLPHNDRPSLMPLYCDSYQYSVTASSWIWRRPYCPFRGTSLSVAPARVLRIYSGALVSLRIANRPIRHLIYISTSTSRYYHLSCTLVRRLPITPSSSKPIFSSVPHTEPMSKRLG